MTPSQDTVTIEFTPEQLRLFRIIVEATIEYLEELIKDPSTEPSMIAAYTKSLPEIKALNLILTKP